MKESAIVLQQNIGVVKRQATAVGRVGAGEVKNDVGIKGSTPVASESPSQRKERATATAKNQSKMLLRELCVDKDYLENLTVDPSNILKISLYIDFEKNKAFKLNKIKQIVRNFFFLISNIKCLKIRCTYILFKLTIVVFNFSLSIFLLKKLFKNTIVNRYKIKSTKVSYLVTLLIRLNIIRLIIFFLCII